MESLLQIVRLMATGQAPLSESLDAIRELTAGEPAPAIEDVLGELRKMPGAGVEKLMRRLRADDLRKIQEISRRLRQENRALTRQEANDLGLPPGLRTGWRDATLLRSAVGSAVRTLRDLAFLDRCGVELPDTRALLIDRIVELAQREFERIGSVWNEITPAQLAGQARDRARARGESSESLAVALKTLMDSFENGRVQQQSEPDRESEIELDRLIGDAVNGEDTPERRAAFDQLFAWPDDRAAIGMREVILGARDEERAARIVALRFGGTFETTRLDWKSWLESAGQASHISIEAAWEDAAPTPEEMLILWNAGRAADADLDLDLLLRSSPAVVPSTLEAFTSRWGDTMTDAERMMLTGVATPAARLEEVEAPTASSMEVDRVVVAPPPMPPPLPRCESVPPEPSLWSEHIQPFVLANWYLVAGILMVLLGSSLLAYYTWDKHWMLRYTIMPGMLAIFTRFLGRMGRWIEERGSQFVGTGAMLRGAALALLPANFIVVALLSSDPEVTHTIIAAPLLLAVILFLFGKATTRWCREVHAELGALIGRPLLALNFFVLLAPLSRMSESAGIITVQGFYVAFAILAGCVLEFADRVTRKLIPAEPRIAWFALIALGATYLQVFGWTHALLRHAPSATAYAALIVLTGGLVLRGEKAAIAIRSESSQEGVESFLGYAFILLGALMGSAGPRTRILACALSGIVWLLQARALKSRLHHWIALSFLVLAFASIGLLPEYPARERVWLGLAAGIILGGTAYWARSGNQSELLHASGGMSRAVLLLTAVVAVLAQWHYQSAPFLTMVQLGIIASLFGRAGIREDRVRWLHTSAVVLAMALPYAGCVDVMQKTMAGNTMPFGLAVLSGAILLAALSSAASTLRAARSTILLFYGVIALAAMAMRVLLERDALPDPMWYREAMDYAGPFFMAAILVVAAWYSRSLLPGIIAVAIMVILFPELRSRLTLTFPWITWGSGLGSSSSALALMILSFFTRDAAFWNREVRSDPFFERGEFPMRRTDHTLFTWPLQAAVVFLLVRVDFQVFLRHLAAGSMTEKTAIAVLLTGVTWILAACYHHESPRASRFVTFGALWLFAGVWFEYHERMPMGRWHDPAVIFQCLMAAPLLFCRVKSASYPWMEGVLAAPSRRVLNLTAILFTVVLLLEILERTVMPDAAILTGILSMLLVQRSRATGRSRHGILLFFLLFFALMDAVTPGDRALLRRISNEATLTPVLVFLLMIRIGEEFLTARRMVERLKLTAVLEPFRKLATALTIFLSISAMGHALRIGDVSVLQHILLIALLFTAARSHGSGFYSLGAILHAYFLLHLDAFTYFDSPAARLMLLHSPRRMAALSVACSFAAWAWLRIRARAPLLARRRDPGEAEPDACPWLTGAAVLIGIFAVVRHSLLPEMRQAPVQLAAPYLASVSFALCAHLLRNSTATALAVASLAAGNIHFIRLTVAPSLYLQGLTPNHVVAIGLGLSILQLAGLQRAITRVKTDEDKSSRVALAHANLVLAAILLLVLAANYLAAPDLSIMTPLRLIVSGVLAFLAGLPYRRAARAPLPGEEDFVRYGEAVHHLGITVAVWCAVLLIPALRTPGWALVALGVPVGFFLARAEATLSGREAASDAPISAVQYRTSASVLSFAILGLYVFRTFFQMLLFPNAPILVGHYHDNALFIFLLSLAMLRLHALGGTSWLAFYGGLSLMVSVYFAVTDLPGLSPFEEPVAGAWSAILLGHFITTATHVRSPLATGLKRLGGFSDESWILHRRSWGIFLVIAVHTAALNAWRMRGADPHAMLPIGLGLASLVIHHAFVRSSQATISAIFHVLGWSELVAALHMDFLVPSLLPADRVVWVLQSCWIAVIVVHQWRPRDLTISSCRTSSFALAMLVFFHVLHHSPSSTVGLLAFSMLGIFCALIPAERREAESAIEEAIALLAWCVPVWLVYFGQRGMTASPTWPILAAGVSAMAIASFIVYIRLNMAEEYLARPRSRPRIADHALALAARRGLEIHDGALWILFFGVLLVQCSHYLRAFEFREFAAAGIIYAAAVLGWHHQGRARPRMTPYIMLQVALAALFALTRRQLMLTTPFWRLEYDIWASLAVSGCLAGAKEAFDLRPPEVRRPIFWTFLLMPVAAISWSMLHGLGTRVTILVVGVNSLFHAYVGRKERKSPYNFVAIAGFTAFVVMTFWAELGLRVAHAFVIPVGVGVLVLLQLFGDDMAAETRNRIRAATLVAMLGSSAYYALIDDRYPVLFHFIVILLALLAMGLGGLLRIRLYLVLGFSALVIDLIALGVKTLWHMERTARMSAIGAVVLVLGAALIGGAVYAKARRDDIDRWIRRWKIRTEGWE